MKTHRLRKKGSIFIWTLFMLIAISVIAAIFINLNFAYEVLNRMQHAADMGAKVRAQAVDIVLKERYGYVETFHDHSGDYTTKDNVPNRSTLPQKEVGYDDRKPLYRPLDEKYRTTRQDADGLAKDAIIEYVNANIGINTDGRKQVDLKPENICLSIRPLPAATDATMSFSCVAKVNGNDVAIQAKDMPVRGMDHPSNQGPDGLQVMNVVFVGIAYEHQHFIYAGVQKALHGSDVSEWDTPPIRQAYSIAYPQIDVCTSTNGC